MLITMCFNGYTVCIVYSINICEYSYREWYYVHVNISSRYRQEAGCPVPGCLATPVPGRGGGLVERGRESRILYFKSITAIVKPGATLESTRVRGKTFFWELLKRPWPGTWFMFLHEKTSQPGHLICIAGYIFVISKVIHHSSKVIPFSGPEHWSINIL